MNAIHLIFIQLFALQLIGPPLAFFFGGDFFYNYLVQDRDVFFVKVAYSSVLYAVVVIMMLYYAFLKKANRVYVAQPLMVPERKKLRLVYLSAVLLSLACLAVLFVQNGFRHPISSILNLNYLDLALKRKEMSESLNLNVYNVGLHLFIAFSIFIAMATRNRWYICCSLLLLALFLPFNLSKSPAVDLMLQLLITFLLYKKYNLTLVLRYLGAGVLLLLCLFYFVSREASDSFSLIVQALVARLFIGEFSPLPTYFEAFQDNASSVLAILPPYVHSLFGIEMKSISKVVIEFMYQGQPDKLEAAGYANSVFVGSAFACAGYAGVLVAPFIVFLNYFLVFKLFTRLKKNMVNVFVFGYLVYRLSKAMFSDIGYFVFSGIQIVLCCYLLLSVLSYILRVCSVGDPAVPTSDQAAPFHQPIAR